MEPNSEPPDENLDIDPEILNRAREGNSFAQLDVATKYENLEKAFYWFTLSAKQANMEAQFRLGDMYALGDAAEKSEFTAYDWYLKSALQGYPKALTRLHNLYHAEKSIYCLGQRDSKESEWADVDFKKKNNIRELYEYRVQQLESELTKIKEYFTKLLATCREQVDGDEEEKKEVAYLILGFLYQHGYGIRKIKNRAIEFYTLAAEKGNTDGAYNLGYIYQHSHNIIWNYREAFRWYTKATENGQICAYNCLAFLYKKGLGTDIDYSKALDLYTKAAENRNVNAMLSIAKMYRNGELLTQNYEPAAEWYNQAIIEGSTVAQNSLELLIANNHLAMAKINSHITNESPKVYSRKGLISRLRSDISNLDEIADLEKLKRLAMNAMIGDGYAMLDIGMKYYNGYVFDQDKDIAFKWIRNAAKSGITTVQCAIAKMYKDGEIIEQNYHKASIWYEKAAKKRDVHARYNLGLLYYHGLGVRKDPLEASRWYTFASNENNSDAQCQLGILRENGEGLRQDIPDAFKWYSTSVKQNNPQAIYRLARMYENGMIGSIDFRLALSMYEKAAQLGNLDAQLQLAKIYEEEDSYYHDKKSAFKYYEMASNQDSPEAKYKLAIIYLEAKGVGRNLIQAYHLFKESSNLGYDNSKNIFSIPINYFKILDVDYHKIADMFRLVCDSGLDSLELNLGYHYANSTYDDIHLKEVWFLKAAEKHIPRAHYELAVIYETKNDLFKAVEYYKKANRLGNTDAAYRLACMYLDGYGVSQDFQKAFVLFNKASDKNHNEAYKILNYFENDNQNVNYDLIKKMFRVSAESGNVISQYKLGLLVLEGGSSKYNIQDAIKWLSMASIGGFIEASYRLGSLLEENTGIREDYQEIIRLYQLAADKGHEMALFRLAKLYHLGENVEKNYLKSYKFYTLAAQQGHQPAWLAIYVTTKSTWENKKSQLNNDLRKLCLDYEVYFHMWEQVAENGNSDLQHKLGAVYEENGGDSNMVEAAKWLSMAARGSHTDALYNLGRLYETGQGVNQDYTKAIKFYERASDLNNNQALYQLGVIYQDGKGVEPNIIAASEYYIKAAKKGNSSAEYALGQLYEEGKRLQQNIFEALKRYSISASQGNEVARFYLDTHFDEVYDGDLFYHRKHRLLFQIIKYYDQAYRQDNALMGSVYSEIANMYRYGYGASVDYKKAWEYYCKSSEIYGDKKTRELLTIKYENINAESRDSYSKKLEMFEALVEQISADDTYQLGLIYRLGVYSYSSDSHSDEKEVLVQPDLYKSSKYFRMIIKKDLPSIDIYYRDCSFYLGMLSFVDVKHTEDSSKAQYYLTNALKSGSSDAQLFLDYINGKNSHKIDEAVVFKNVFDWYYENQNASNAEVIYKLGWMYDEGLGTSPNYEKAVECYAAAANQNYTLAYLKLGYAYLSGNGAKRNYEEATKWYTKAAELNNAVANYNLGNVYFNGITVAKNYLRAFEYYKTAAERGHADSQNKLGIMYSYGYGVEKNLRLAHDWYSKAAHQSNINANYALGNMYFYGDGLVTDYEKAFRYYVVAAEQGHIDAQIHLGLFHVSGYGVEQDNNMALQWYTEAAKQKRSQYRFLN